MNPPVRIGLEVCLAQPPDCVRGARLGLLVHGASLDHRCQPTHELFAARFPGRVRALFGPQHGWFGEQQDDMVETPHAQHPRLHVAVHSLYSETRAPSPAMLAEIDQLVVDLQDAGTRVYTYAWTLLLCLRACAAAGVGVVLLDRPNPIGGELVEGPRLEPGLESFVGMAAIPMRHGLTLGELARWLNRDIGAVLEVVPMHGWRRGMLFADTGRRWVPPSPNLPRSEGALLYPGQVLLEGTNLSEGRGTTTPFEICGAPFVDPWALRDALQRHDLPGLALQPLRFTPTFQKWAGTSCGGLFLHAVDTAAFRPYRTSLALLHCVQNLWPDQFEWRPPPYEYETGRMPIDILSGDPALRHDLANLEPAGVAARAAVDATAWWREVEEDLLYPR